MKEVLKFKIAYCKDCKGARITMPVPGYKKIGEIKDFLNDKKEDSVIYFTENESKYEKLKIKLDLIEKIVSFDYFLMYEGADCGCTAICRKVKTFADACKVLKLPDVLPDYSFLPAVMQKRLLSMYKLIIITKALNKGWEPKFEGERNYTACYPTAFYNSDQDFPYKHDLGFFNDTCKVDNIDHNAGTLLMFKDWGVANYAGTQFRDLYLDVYQYPESYLNRNQKE